MILIVGSINRLECEIGYLLASQGISIRALVLNPSNSAWIERLKNYGATLAIGDLHDPIFVADTYVGVNGVICSPIVLSPGLRNVDQQGISNLIDAARDADVLRFVYISFLNQPESNFSSGQPRSLVEQCLIESGIPYTILHAGHYPPPIFGSRGQPIGQISVQNLARLAIQALENPVQCNIVVEVTSQ